MDTGAVVRTMILREQVPTATTRAIKSMTSKVRESSYKLDSHTDKCVFGRGTLIVYAYNRQANAKGYNQSLGKSEYSTVTGVNGYIHTHTFMGYHIVTHQGISIPHLEHHLLFLMLFLF